MGDATGYRFLSSENKEYSYLSPEDMDILDTVIQELGKTSKSELVKRMHKESAYIETEPHDIIQFKYTQDLSLS